MSSPVLASPTPHQLSFDELGSALRDITFVVVDLEITGGRPDEDGITEIGAVKVRGGEVIGELATLIDPGRGVPPQITELTGITTAMLRDAPPIRTVLPSFLEFAAGAVLVAHNAPFDMGFLRAACTRNGMVWPKPRVLSMSIGESKFAPMNCPISVSYISVSQHRRRRYPAASLAPTCWRTSCSIASASVCTARALPSAKRA